MRRSWRRRWWHTWPLPRPWAAPSAPCGLCVPSSSQVSLPAPPPPYCLNIWAQLFCSRVSLCVLEPQTLAIRAALLGVEPQRDCGVELSKTLIAPKCYSVNPETRAGDGDLAAASQTAAQAMPAECVAVHLLSRAPPDVQSPMSRSGLTPSQVLTLRQAPITTSGWNVPMCCCDHPLTDSARKCK